MGNKIRMLSFIWDNPVVISKEIKIEDIQIGNEEIKLLFLTDGRFHDHPLKFTKELLEIIGEFSKTME